MEGQAPQQLPLNESNGYASNGQVTNQSGRGITEPFVVSAPGKVIVFGEHAVVHGKAAMAASISLRSYLLVTPTPSRRPSVTLTFPDISLQHTWHLDTLPFAAFAHPSKTKRFDEQVTTLDPDLVATIQPHIANVSSHLPPKARLQHHAAASCFLYILLSLTTPSQNMHSTTYSLRSTIPIGAGLGSSASISVCISSALLLQNGHIPLPNTLPNPNSSLDTTQADHTTLDIINHWAFVGELNIHGTPSGVDNTVATKGKAVLFRRTAPGQPPLVTSLHDFPVLPLLLVDTKQSRSTAVEVAKVAALKSAHAGVVELILDAVDRITEEAHSLISQPGFDAAHPESLQRLGELIRMNHGLLVALSVSHPKLERVRELIDMAEIGYTKLTGAGGGGCAITLLRPDATEDMLRELEERIEAEGFAKYETTLGGEGVGVTVAVGVSQEEFLGAKESRDVEALMREEKVGRWRYWSV